MEKKKLQRQHKSVSHSSWSCLHASSLSYTDKCSRHSAQDEPPPQREASLTCGRQFSYLFQNWNQVQPVLGWKMLEDTTVPTGYEGHRLKELARCSVVVCFSPGNCVLRYDRPRRRHKQAINANTRSWFNERDGVEALGHLMKRLLLWPHKDEDPSSRMKNLTFCVFLVSPQQSNNGGQAVPSASHCSETRMLWRKNKTMHSSTITVDYVYNHLAEAARLCVFTLPAPCSPAMMRMGLEGDATVVQGFLLIPKTEFHPIRINSGKANVEHFIGWFHKSATVDRSSRDSTALSMRKKKWWIKPQSVYNNKLFFLYI